MIEILIGVLVGMVLVLGVIVLWRFRGRSRSLLGNIAVHSSIEQMRSLGELSVFKVITKEIVTADRSVFGEAARRYLNWMVTSKKMAMILTFDMDFRYDLTSSEFQITTQEGGEQRYRVKMPKAKYETHILDLTIYDEENSQFLPALLPDILSRVFGGGFNEKEKNELIAEAKRQAGKQAEQLVEQIRSQVEGSARTTLTAIATGFGAKDITFDFGTRKPVQEGGVHYREGAGVDTGIRTEEGLVAGNE